MLLVVGGDRDPGGQGREATALIGEFFAGRKLHFGSQAVAGGTVYTLRDGTDASVQRILIALAPDRSGSMKLDNLRLKLPSSDKPQDWAIEAIQYSATTPCKKLTQKSEHNKGDVIIRWDRDVADPALLMLKTER